MRIFAALFRWLSNLELLQALKIGKKADEVFTHDAEGIGLAFDHHQQKLIRDYQEFQDAVAQVEMAVEQKRQRLEDTEKNLGEARTALEGALAQYATAEEAGDQKAMDEAERYGTEFQAEVERLEQLEDDLEGEIAGHEQEMEGLLGRLEDMQGEIQKLDSEKAEAIADFVSDRALIEANEKLAGIKSSVNEGPINAVRESRRKMRAKAKVSGKIAGVDAKRSRDKFLKQGRDAANKSRFAEMAAARKAEKDGATGDGDAASSDKERPQI